MSIPAPVPQRASLTPQTMPNVPTTWDPAMGIKFGGGGGASGNVSAQPRQSGGGTWDPSKGMRFG